MDVATRGGILDGIRGPRRARTTWCSTSGARPASCWRTCGPRIRRPTLVGLDLVAEGLRKAHASVPEALLLLADCTRLPLPDASAGAIVSANVLEHVADDVAALREMHRMLRPGGARAPSSCPAGPGLYDYYDRFLGHERRYARGELAAKGREAGLRVRAGRDHRRLPVPSVLGGQEAQPLPPSRPLGATSVSGSSRSDIARTQNSSVGAALCRFERALRRRGREPALRRRAPSSSSRAPA